MERGWRLDCGVWVGWWVGEVVICRRYRVHSPAAILIAAIEAPRRHGLGFSNLFGRHVSL